MKLLMTSVVSLALFAANLVHAQDPFSITATGATGAPGDRVFVTLTYDYGTGVEVIAENFDFSYDSPELSFVFDDSTIVHDGGLQSLAGHIEALELIAAPSRGLASFNLAPNTLPAGKGGFQLAFTQPDFFGFPGHVRTGQVVFNAAFDIAATAPDGDYFVSFGSSKLTDFQSQTFDVIEYGYPAALNNVQVTVQAAVVPDPEAVLMLLPGLLMVGLVARRRRTGRQHAGI